MSDITEKALAIETSQTTAALSNADRRITEMLSGIQNEIGHEVSLQGERMVIEGNLTPEEALTVMFRLKSEMNTSETAFRKIRLWMGDFALQYAEQNGVSVNTAANELAEVFEEKPKRMLRLINTSKRSTDNLRAYDVHYTLLQELADLPEPEEADEKEQIMKAKESILEGVANGQDSAWAKKSIKSIRHAMDPEQPGDEPKADLLTVLMEYYNTSKLSQSGSFGIDEMEYARHLSSLESTIENLANSRGITLWFRMRKPPFEPRPSDEELGEIEGTINSI